jgi:hypothetical protein
VLWKQIIVSRHVTVLIPSIRIHWRYSWLGALEYSHCPLYFRIRNVNVSDIYFHPYGLLNRKSQPFPHCWYFVKTQNRTSNWLIGSCIFDAQHTQGCWPYVYRDVNYSIVTTKWAVHYFLSLTVTRRLIYSLCPHFHGVHATKTIPLYSYSKKNPMI